MLDDRIDRPDRRHIHWAAEWVVARVAAALATAGIIGALAWLTSLTVIEASVLYLVVWVWGWDSRWIRKQMRKADDTR